MTARKKKGIGFFISGAAFVAAGIVFVTTAATPDWFNMAISIAGIVASALGFVIVYPDTEE